MTSLKQPSVEHLQFPAISVSDTIFRYTKALDAIKNLRKERMADLKAEKERLSHLQLEKSRAEKVMQYLALLHDDV
jgi:DNA repair protein RAD50